MLGVLDNQPVVSIMLDSAMVYGGTIRDMQIWLYAGHHQVAMWFHIYTGPAPNERTTVSNLGTHKFNGTLKHTPRCFVVSKPFLLRYIMCSVAPAPYVGLYIFYV